MHQTEQTTEPTQDPGPKQARQDLPGIAFLLALVRKLLAYGQHLDTILPAQTASPRFPTFAKGFGTLDVKLIIARIQRGILTAMMLEKFLLAREARKRDIVAKRPEGPAEPEDVEKHEIELRQPRIPRDKALGRTAADIDHPNNFYIPSLKEIEAHVRRTPVGQLIAEISLDLGITVHCCDGAAWQEIWWAMKYFGANMVRYGAIVDNRLDTFTREQEHGRNTRDTDGRDRPREAIRELVGCLVGEPSPSALAAAA